jgi:hypothetical protein
MIVQSIEKGLFVMKVSTAEFSRAEWGSAAMEGSQLTDLVRPGLLGVVAGGCYVVSLRSSAE